MTTEDYWLGKSALKKIEAELKERDFIPEQKQEDVRRPIGSIQEANSPIVIHYWSTGPETWWEQQMAGEAFVLGHAKTPTGITTHSEERTAKVGDLAIRDSDGAWLEWNGKKWVSK